MNRREFFSYYLLNVALLGNFADFYMGDVVASFLGIPIILLGKVIYFLSPDLFYISLMLLALLTLVVTFAGMRVIPTERFAKLLLPKILGFLLAFFWVKVRVSNLILVGMIYNFFYKLCFQYFVSKDLINDWGGELLGLNIFWEKLLLLFSVAFSAGIATNLIYHCLRMFGFVF